MKKLLALCLSLALCLGSVVTAAAAEYGPYTLADDFGSAAHFDAAYLTTETVKFKDPDSDGIYPHEITVLNLKPGSSVKISGWFGANNYLLVDGAYEMGASWKEFSSGPVANMFGGQPYLFLTWVNDQEVYFKMGEKTVAPAPASALRSGILTKSGIFGVVVLSFTILDSFGHTWGNLLLVPAVITMVLGAVLATRIPRSRERGMSRMELLLCGLILLVMAVQYLL